MTQTDTQPEAPVRAETHQFTAVMISPEAEAWSRQATLDHHLANVRIAEQQFRAVTWNLLVFLASDHNGPDKPEVIVARWGYPSVYGPVRQASPAGCFQVGEEPGTVHRFTDAQVQGVSVTNGYITLNIC